jgi:hypothetical protein
MERNTAAATTHVTYIAEFFLTAAYFLTRHSSELSVGSIQFVGPETRKSP